MLKWVAHSKVEREVAPEVGVDEGIVFLAVPVGRIDGFHAGIEAQDEVVEVETQAQSVGDGNLLVEAVETEGSSRLLFVVADGPDVAGVDEERPR